MIPTRLVQQIEDHWEAVHARFLRMLRAQPELVQINRLPESELQDISRRLLRNLSRYLSAGASTEISLIYERVGRENHLHGRPLSETIRGLQLLKAAAVGFVRDQGIFDTSVDLYAEEELEHALGHFFDLLIYHIALGYEQAATLPAVHPHTAAASH
jgi:hypothetical protein